MVTLRITDHLANCVVLKWFGKEITGKKNVAAFIAFHKTESFHTFHDIMPILDITAEEKQLNGSRESLDQNTNNKCKTHTCNEELTRYSHETEMSMNHENEIDFNRGDKENGATSVHKNGYDTFNIVQNKLKMMTVLDDVNANTDVNQNEISAKAIAKMDDKSYDLNKNDLCNLFEPEITSEAIVEKIQNINRTELKEEMAPTIRAINRECGQGDGPVIVEAGTTKYLEANGTIKFSRLNIREDSLFLYHHSKSWKKKNWERKCRLQIAYSFLIDNVSPEIVKIDMQKNVPSTTHSNAHKIQTKLPSLEEAIQVSNTSIKDSNNFGGYLQPLNFSEDRKNYLKTFEAEMQKNFNVQSCVRYVKNKLIFDYPNKKPLLNVMYKIHKIIYTEVQ
ncbi:uncharacterized protein LOC114942599 isoform X2 [Nylanderia fulva]|uniref:uncharacterized protein LOC114942599 isoform X2 n=1 Tax=Nylanderia fulva TaxID=613905 RepID=UPI0010FAEEB1|nr:uncharacterized protein LOC114942599 isoform X2 [Nylanderia fulva]